MIREISCELMMTMIIDSQSIRRFNLVTYEESLLLPSDVEPSGDGSKESLSLEVNL